MIGYRLHEFPASPQPLPTPWGGVAHAAEYPFVVGATLKQWANIELAQAHVAEAIKMLAEMDPELDAPPNLQDGRANRRQSRLQFGFLVKLSRHVARAYNALGVLWYNDPDHRVIYRKYFSGPPVAPEEDYNSVFRKTYNWGGVSRWYQKNEGFPLIPAGSKALGELPDECRILFDRYGKDAFGGKVTRNKIHFVQQMSFVTAPLDGNERPESSVFYAGNLRNETLFNWSDEMYECVNVMGEPWSSDDMVSDDKRCFVRTFDVRKMAVKVGNVEAGTELGMAYDSATSIARPAMDWRSFSYDLNRNALDPSVPIRVAPPLRSYLPYLAEVAESLNSRHPYDVIQASRAFPVWNNKKTVEFNDGIESTLRSAIATEAEVFQQQAAGSDELRAASEVTKTLTTAIGPVIPFPGNIIVMAVGGVAGLIMDALNGTVIKGRVQNNGRDDLGRFKIILDPQVIYRNIEATSPPQFPDTPESVPASFRQSEQSLASMREILRYRDFEAMRSYMRDRFQITPELSRLALRNAVAFKLNRQLQDREDDNTGLVLFGAAAAAIAYYAYTRGPSPATVKASTASKSTKRAKSTKGKRAKRAKR